MVRPHKARPTHLTNDGAFPRPSSPLLLASGDTNFRFKPDTRDEDEEALLLLLPLLAKFGGGRPFFTSSRVYSSSRRERHISPR